MPEQHETGKNYDVGIYEQERNASRLHLPSPSLSWSRRANRRELNLAHADPK